MIGHNVQQKEAEMDSKTIISMSETEYLEECRKKYWRLVKDSVRVEVSDYADKITKEIFPDSPADAYQLKTALNRLIRTKFKIVRVANLTMKDKDAAMKFLNDVRELLR
jgi:hypothetical protein